MYSLSAQHIIQVWEIGQLQHPLDRALTVLSFALPDRSWEELASLTIGQRDACLLALRELTLGSKLESFVECPHCQERLEFSLNTSDIRVFDGKKRLPSEQTFTVDELQVQYRLPTSYDLAAIAHCQDIELARGLLAKQCIRQVDRQGVSISLEGLPDLVLSQLADRLATDDPQAEVLLNVSCPACQHSWQVLFDIVSFFWTELTVQAKRLLREVHLLAKTYGWQEADILAMNATRRQLYLDMVMA